MNRYVLFIDARARQNQSNQALMSRSAAGAINPSSALTTSLLGSAGSVASSWYQYNKAGAK